MCDCEPTQAGRISQGLEEASRSRSGEFATNLTAPDDISGLFWCFLPFPCWSPKRRDEKMMRIIKTTWSLSNKLFFRKKIRFSLKLTWWFFFRFYYCLLQSCTCAIVEIPNIATRSLLQFPIANDFILTSKQTLLVVCCSSVAHGLVKVVRSTI